MPSPAPILALLSLAPLVSTTAVLPPLFAQYRFDGLRGGNSNVSLGPGASPPTLFQNFTLGVAGLPQSQPVVAADGTAVVIGANGDVAAVVPGAAVPSWTYQMQAAPAAAAAATAAISPDGAVVVVCAGTWVCVLDMVLGLQRALLLMRIVQPEPSALVRNASGGRANVASPCA